MKEHIDKDPSAMKGTRKTFGNMKGKIHFRWLNKLIILLGFTILLLLGILIAQRENFINVPSPFINAIEVFITILISYTMATIIIRLTINRVPGIFGPTLPIEEKILLSKAYLALIYTISTVIVFLKLGITVQNIAIFLGLIATGFAFAIRDVILSYIVWFILLTKKPFKIGDYIDIGDAEGQVKHIGMFYVLVDDSPETYNDFYKIPNKIFLERPIKNYGKDKFNAHFDLYIDKVPADLGEKMEQLRSMIEKEVGSKAKLFLDSDEDGIKINVEYRTNYRDRESLKDKIIITMIKELENCFEK